MTKTGTTAPANAAATTAQIRRALRNAGIMEGVTGIHTHDAGVVDDQGHVRYAQVWFTAEADVERITETLAAFPWVTHVSANEWFIHAGVAA